MIRALLLLMLAGPAWAGGITFADVCEPPRFRQVGPDLLIYCPGQATPWLTWRNCKSATVRRQASGRYVVTCK